MNQDEWKDLLQSARTAREHAYAPYSSYLVGAALLGEDGRTYAGANVENASYGATICAERSAVCTAVSQGVRNFRGLALITEGEVPASPCGLCLQVLCEFNPDLPLLLATTGGETVETKLSQLLPRRFGKEALE